VIRYIWSVGLRSRRWSAPLLAFCAVVVVLYPTGGDVRQSLTLGALSLTPVTAWLVVSAVNMIEPAEEAVLVVAQHGIVRTRLWIVVAALLAGFALTAVSAGSAVLRDPQSLQTPSRLLGALAVGCLGHAVAGLWGAAIGAAATRPIVTRPSSSIVIVVAATIVGLVVPTFPAANGLLHAMSSTTASGWSLIINALLSTLLSAAVIAAATTLGRRRT
jgi:hypothetical protein